MFNELGVRLRRSLPRRGFEATDTHIARAMLRELLENFEQGYSEMLPDGFVRDIPELDRRLYADPRFRLGNEAGATVRLCSPHGESA
ncbi:MAG: hypothetical protein HT580_16720 [Dechloromonas sp.]|nr:MAG: hypothetical protein HT580_16720 [Dechloromonas sp.]